MPLTDEMLMMHPPRRWIMKRAQTHVRYNVPFRLRSTQRSMSDSLIVAKIPSLPMPALLTTAPICPYRSETSDTNRFTPAESVASTSDQKKFFRSGSSSDCFLTNGEAERL